VPVPKQDSNQHNPDPIRRYRSASNVGCTGQEISAVRDLFAKSGNVHTNIKATNAIFTFPVISFASAGGAGFGQKKPVTGSIRNCPSTIRRVAATSAIKRIRRHDSGRFNPITDQLPSRSRIDIKPSTERMITSFGTT
jgi:hypothetical protein